MNDSLLVSVLNRLADENEQAQPFLGGQLILVAILRNLNPAHQFHHEVRTAHSDAARISLTHPSGTFAPHVGEGRSEGVFCRSRVENLRDVRMIHHGEGLALGLESGNDLPAVHAQLDNFQGHAALDRLALLRHPYFTKAAFAELLEQFVAANHLGRGFRDWKFGDSGPLSVESGSPQEPVVGKMFSQQLVHLLTESEIPTARSLK